MCTNDSYVNPYLLRPCRSYAEARRYSARGLARTAKRSPDRIGASNRCR